MSCRRQIYPADSRRESADRWAAAFAKYFGLSQIVIGRTSIAIGTGLPELATSALANPKERS